MNYEQLKAVVMAYFEDQSRSASATKADLNGLADECRMLADSLPDSDDGEDD